MKKKTLILTALATLGLTTATMAQTVPSYVPTNGLVGWWPFNGNANDESGNNNNGVVTGAITTSDRFGSSNSAYSFDGISDYIDCGNSNSVNTTDDITISVWINSNNFNIDHGIVSKYPQYNLVTNAPFTQPPLDRLRFESDNAPFLFSNPILSNQWLSVVAVYSTISGKSIYINGIIFASDPQVGIVPSNSPSNLYLGAHQPLTVNYWSWDGKLDDIGIWNRALTQQEITSLYTNSSVGINEVSQSNLFSVYPNPAQSVITVNTDVKLVGLLFAIYDNAGKLVKTGNIKSENTTIELGNLSNGIYMLSLGENMKQSFKVIKE